MKQCTQVLTLLTAGFLLGAGAFAGSFTSDFSDPNQPGFTLAGGTRPNGDPYPAFIKDATGNDCLALTFAENSEQGTILFDELDPGATVASFKLSVKVRIGGGTSTPADGLAVYFGTAPLYGATFGEEGPEGTDPGITVCIDTYDNTDGDPTTPGGEAPAIDVKVNGVTIATTPVNVFFPLSDTFVPLNIELKENGLLNVDFKGTVIYTNLVLVGYAPMPGAQFAIGARTGGLNANHWIDDISITTVVAGAPVAASIVQQPQSQTVAEHGSVTFSVIPGGTPPFTYEWYKNNAVVPGATGPSLTLNDVSFADNNAKFKVRVTNAQGSAISDEVTLTVQQDVVAPTIVYARGSDTFDTVTIGFSEPVAITGATFVIDKGLSVTSTTQPNSTTVVLGTSKQTPGEVYTITVNGVKDLAFIPNSIASDTKVSFSAWVLAIGFLRHEYWGGLNTAPGTIDDLLSDPRYPNAPDQVGYVSAFDTRTIFPNDTHEYYGAKMSGFIIPKETADYYFFIRSDDASQLYLSTDESPDNVVLIAEETGCCNAFLEPGALQTSFAPIRLVAGQRYYVMAVMKEGTGGDYCQVAWRKDGDPTPASSLTPIPGEFLATYADPGIATIEITKQPEDFATSENKTATFTVSATGSPPPLIYQWQRANPGSTVFENIPGATSASYTTPLLKRATDHGARYRVLVTVPGKTVASAEATLSVEIDITPPSLVRVASGVDFKSVYLIFSEPMDTASISDVSNYTIPGLNVTGVRVLSDRTVMLLTSQQSEDTTYTVTCGPGIKDTAIPANAIDPSANSGTFTSPVLIPEAMAWEIWTGLATDTVAVSELTSDPRYPLDPSQVKLTPGYEGPGFGDGYGARVRGWITPKVTDDYVFFVAADDNAELWLSTDDTVANKRLIALEPNWANQREWTGDSGGRRPCLAGNPCENVSLPIRLEAGKRYYTELLWKEGGGGDHAAVAWKRASAPDPENGSAPMWGEVLSTAIQKSLLRSVALPVELASPVGSGHADKPGFIARVYQVDQQGSTVSVNQTSRAEQELAGLLGPNVADLSGAVDGVFLIDTIINWNQDGVDIGSIPGDTFIPGIPGLGSNFDRNTDNIAVEIITYAEFPKAGAYMMAVASDDGFKVTATDKAPTNIRAVRVHPPSSAAGSYYAADGSTQYGGAFKPITAPIVGKVVLAEPDHACEPLVNADKMPGAIALIYRGVCRFDAKVPRAVEAGAIAAIIVNNRDPGSAEGIWPIVMGGSYPYASAVMISKPDGDKIRAALMAGEEVIADITPDDTPALGEFDGGRGIADTFFPIYVLEPGVYPLRLVWYEGEGGANVEWFMFDGAGNRVALNDRTNPTAVKTYRARTYVPVVTPEIKGIALQGANVVITYKGVLQQASKLPAAPSEWSDVPGASSTGYATYTTSAGGTEKYFRARKP